MPRRKKHFSWWCRSDMVRTCEQYGVGKGVHCENPAHGDLPSPGAVQRVSASDSGSADPQPPPSPSRDHRAPSEAPREQAGGRRSEGSSAVIGDYIVLMGDLDE